MYNTDKPKSTAPMINVLFTNPSTEKEILMRIVEITNPEFRKIL